jgi:hypothetical protein
MFSIKATMHTTTVVMIPQQLTCILYYNSYHAYHNSYHDTTTVIMFNIQYLEYHNGMFTKTVTMFTTTVIMFTTIFSTFNNKMYHAQFIVIKKTTHCSLAEGTSALCV